MDSAGSARIERIIWMNGAMPVPPGPCKTPTRVVREAVTIRVVLAPVLLNLPALDGHQQSLVPHDQDDVRQTRTWLQGRISSRRAVISKT